MRVIDLEAVEMNELVELVLTQIEFLEDVRKGESDFDPVDENELKILNRIAVKFASADIKWEQYRDGIWKTNIRGQDFFRMVIE